MDKNILTYAFVAFLIAFIVHMMYNLNKQNKQVETEPFISFVEEEIPVPKRKRRKPKRPSYGSSFDFHDHGSVISKTSPHCPLIQNEEDNELYLKEFLLGNNEVCPEPQKPVKEFNHDFFTFRDKTNINSSMREDPVDKIQQMYLDGNLDEARRYPNMKIKDIFDEATKGPSLYTRQCVRLPSYDNVNPDGYYMNPGTQGMSLTRNKWHYDNEKIMNGGEIVPNLKGNDPEYNKYLSTTVMNNY